MQSAVLAMIDSVCVWPSVRHTLVSC